MVAPTLSTGRRGGAGVAEWCAFLLRVTAVAWRKTVREHTM